MRRRRDAPARGAEPVTEGVTMSQPPHIVPDGFLVPGEIATASAIVATLMGWLPPIAAALGIVWYLILIYDRLFSRSSKP